MRFLRSDVQRGQELLGLVVQVGALPAKSLDDRLPLGEGRPCGAVQRRVVRERVPEVDDFGSLSLLNLLGIALAASL